jgi:hypothetical protein
MLALFPEVQPQAETFIRTLESTSHVQTSLACPWGWGLIPKAEFTT